MPYVTLPGGITAHVRMAKRARRRCSADITDGPTLGVQVVARCHASAAFQCDYTLRPGRTCDAWLCAMHAKAIGPDLHHCPAHAAQQRGLFTELVE